MSYRPTGMSGQCTTATARVVCTYVSGGVGDSAGLYGAQSREDPVGRDHGAVTVTITHPSIGDSPDVIGQSLPVLSFPLLFWAG